MAVIIAIFFPLRRSFRNASGSSSRILPPFLRVTASYVVALSDTRHPSWSFLEIQRLGMFSISFRHVCYMISGSDPSICVSNSPVVWAAMKTQRLND